MNYFYIKLFIFLLYFHSIYSLGFRSTYPTICDSEAALKCEYDFLLCQLFNGPANDAETLCTCATEFYGSCLRLAGVSIHFPYFLFFFSFLFMKILYINLNNNFIIFNIYLIFIHYYYFFSVKPHLKQVS